MSLTSDQQGALDLHNAARTAVGVGPLAWSSSLQADAQKWADYLASSGGGLQHDPNAGEGENLFWSSPPGNGMLSAATQDWLGEKTQYLANHGGGFTEATGHYTQCVWYSTTSVGIAQNGSFVVARYSPQGNVVGQVAYPQDGNGNPTGGSGGGGGGGGGPSPSGPNGLLLLNGIDANGNGHSTVGWYPHIANVVGTQPQAIVDFSGIETWEQQNQSVTFPDGNVFTWSINADAQAQAFGTQVGTAKNNYQSYTIFKDDQHIVYSENGLNYKTIYWCQ
ncbi:PR-1-like protein [Hyaloscypha variabilis F]|uniref:PR-1-like protein n=1 Tax=Hyaloscypha variabilis (strain UAMH 11265 / GT02V1 / F) TaxID=1149755 RepID=A0A2J6S546_HYAVF|nr:PR-1-like protein [Hyaloscypha variabilis F]